MSSAAPVPCKFTSGSSGGTYPGWVEAEILPGIVKLTEVTTNPNDGGWADMGSYTYAQVLAGSMRSDLPPELVTDVQTYVRTLVGALEALLAAVNSIGEANDAADRGYNEASAKMTAAAPGRAREAWALAPDALSRVLPALVPIADGKLEMWPWHDVANRIEQVLHRR